MGHLNTRFYLARAMESLVGLAAELGMPRAFAADTQATLTVREHHIRFMKEARAGGTLHITGGVIAMGESDARLLLLVKHGDGALAASIQTVVAHTTAREGRAFPWSERVRARAETLKVEVPPQAAPRSISIGPVDSQASLARAQALGLKQTGAGAIRVQDCDVFGRMAAEVLMARISDGAPNLLEGRDLVNAQGGTRIGGAALEYRLVHLDWPRAGDRVQLRSGIAAVEPRFRRMIHWLLDPQTGRPWGVGEAIGMSFDLDARKLVTLSDEALAQARTQVVEGLTL